MKGQLAKAGLLFLLTVHHMAKASTKAFKEHSLAEKTLARRPKPDLHLYFTIHILTVHFSRLPSRPFQYQSYCLVVERLPKTFQYLNIPYGTIGCHGKPELNSAFYSLLCCRCRVLHILLHVVFKKHMPTCRPGG
jgi:hypothetical protein